MRSFAWMTRFRRLVRNYERLAETMVGLHFVAFAMLMAHRLVTFMVQSSVPTLGILFGQGSDFSYDVL
jgi:hypothetical protein